MPNRKNTYTIIEAVKKLKVARAALTVATLILLLLSAPGVHAQVKQWTDEHGVTHFESHNTGKTPSQRAGDANAPTGPGLAKTPIERTHAGLTLGDNDSSFRSSKQWLLAFNDKFGMQGYLGLPSGDITKKGVGFVDGRLAMIMLTYKESTFGSWASAVKSTSDKYGSPKGNGYSEATWTDGKTSLTLKKDFRGGLEVAIGDVELSTRYTSRSGQAAPKF
jgi:hypothetical protein